MKKLTSKEHGTATINRNHDGRHSYWNLATLSLDTKDFTSGTRVLAPHETFEFF